MPVRLNGSTSGYTELSAPAVAGNNTITFPTTSGTAVVNGANSAIVSGTAVASTSGTSIDFTGIPSWVKKITVMFNGVSTNGTSNPLIQIGAGSFSVSGYLSSASNFPNASATQSANSSAGFLVTGATNASSVLHGSAIISTTGSNVWVNAGTGGRSDQAATWNCGGSVTLSGTLDRVRVTTVNGTDTFDAGSINILYE
jgi:hypothetical protein